MVWALGSVVLPYPPFRNPLPKSIMNIPSLYNGLMLGHVLLLIRGICIRGRGRRHLHAESCLVQIHRRLQLPGDRRCGEDP